MNDFERFQREQRYQASMTDYEREQYNRYLNTTDRNRIQPANSREALPCKPQVNADR